VQGGRRGTLRGVTGDVAQAPRRHVRLVFALAVAALLGIFAVYTAFVGDTTPLVGVAQAAEGQHAGKPVKLTGEVLRHSGNAATAGGLAITLKDNGTARTVRVVYHGDVPDAFGDGKHVVVDGRMQNGVFVAKTDSLVTKCPSKYGTKSDS